MTVTTGHRPDRTIGRLLAAIQELSLARDLDTITAIVRRTARELTGADGATFVLRENGLCHYVDEDAIGPLWKGRRFPMESCISGWVMSNREPVAITDIYADPRIPVDAYRPTFVQSLVMVPIRTADPIGAIGCYWAATHAASSEETQLQQALADATAAAMERVRMQQELEQRVSERTSELEAANHRLAVEIEERRQAEKNLKSSEQLTCRMRMERDQMPAMLASAIAHELNQPLTAATTYTETALGLLRRDEGDPRQIIDLMEKATAQNWRAVEVVRRFRELLRRGESDLRAVGVNDIIRSTMELVAEEARELGVAIGLDIAGGPGLVNCDRLQIEHVILNILRNALEAMRDAGTIRGSIRIRIRPGRPGFLRVSIADDGPGMNDETRRKLFTPFHTTKATGVGLGLSVSRNIVEANGGELWADPGERHGARFYFTLPLADASRTPELTTTQSRSSPSQPVAEAVVYPQRL